VIRAHKQVSISPVRRGVPGSCLLKVRACIDFHLFYEWGEQQLDFWMTPLRALCTSPAPVMFLHFCHIPRLLVVIHSFCILSYSIAIELPG
jgi:hypothetical protein